MFANKNKSQIIMTSMIFWCLSYLSSAETMLKLTRTDAEKQPGVINELRLSDTAFDLVTIDFFSPVLSFQFLHSKSIPANCKSTQSWCFAEVRFTHHRSSRWSSLCDTASPWPGRLGWLHKHPSHTWHRYLFETRWLMLFKNPPGYEADTSSFAIDCVSDIDNR